MLLNLRAWLLQLVDLFHCGSTTNKPTHTAQLLMKEEDLIYCILFSLIIITEYYIQPCVCVCVSVYMHAHMFNDRHRQLTWQWCEPDNHHKPYNVLKIPVRMAAFVSRDGFSNYYRWWWYKNSKVCFDVITIINIVHLDFVSYGS